MIEDTYKYNSVEVAKYLVAKMNEKKITVNMTKVQKLLYICYGVFLAVKNSRLLNEHPQAWPYGPVFPTTRNKLLKIKNLYDIKISDKQFEELKNDTDLNYLMNSVLEVFGVRTAQYLVKWSHVTNAPWDRTVNMVNFEWGDEIPDIFIKEYFSERVVQHE